MMAVRTTGLALAIALLATAAHAQANADWTRSGGDLGDTKYSPLNQINASTIKRLKIAWRAPAIDPLVQAENPQLAPNNNYLDAPLVVGGVMYISNQIGQVEARDPGTGKVIWRQANFPGDGPLTALRSARGLAVSGEGANLRIITVRGSYLYLLDAKTGAVVPSFGDKGRVDLRDDPKGGLYYWRTPNPIVVKDVIVIGGQPTAAGTPDPNRPSLPGDIRGYDVRTGKLLWTFHSVPHEGEPGTETWENESWRQGGKTYTWNGFSGDDKLGYVYVPLSAPTNDNYGGVRPGDNLYSDSLVAIDVKTGKKVWHFQTVHHDLWDYDIPTPPMLADIKVNGRLRKAAIQVTKTAYVFAFDRATGEPLFPIVETPVPASTVPGEKAARTQPIPVKPAPFDRQGVSEDALIDFTPALRAEAVRIMNRFTVGDIFTPPTVKGGPEGKEGTLYMPGWVGGANWTGAALDPETGVIYIPSVSVPWIAGLEPDGRGGYRRARIEGSGLYMDGPQGLPLVKPPYGRITAIDMNSGDHLWMAPNGGGPRDHPLLKGLNLPALGQPGRAAPLLTKSFLFIGEGSEVGQSMPKFSGGNMFRAYDKKTGKVIWEADLGAGTTTPPVTYMSKGKQYIVVGVAGANHPAELVAMTLE
jgi:quinoprotein glucose dehydrogenase